MWVSYSREPAAQCADLSGWVVWVKALYELSQPRPTANMLLQAATIMHAETIMLGVREIHACGLATVESRPRSAPISLVGSSGRELYMNTRSRDPAPTCCSRQRPSCT